MKKYERISRPGRLNSIWKTYFCYDPPVTLEDTSITIELTLGIVPAKRILSNRLSTISKKRKRLSASCSSVFRLNKNSLFLKKMA